LMRRAVQLKAFSNRRTFSTGVKVLSETEVLAGMRTAAQTLSKTPTYAMYNSAYGGIIRDVAFMCIPLDDHMVHRGHAVFDTANVFEGDAYGLTMHLDRLLRSANDALISHTYEREELRQIVLSTIAATGLRDGVFVRYWLSSGCGDFSVTPKGSTGAQFYVVVHEDNHSMIAAEKASSACTVEVPLKPPALARIKSTNYMLNAHVAMTANKAGADFGVQFNSDGMLQESAVSMVAIVTPEGELCAPPFDAILSSTTMGRVQAIAADLKAAGLIQSQSQRSITKEELKGAKEVINIGGGYVTPIGSFDGDAIGDGTPGPVYKALHTAIIADFRNPELLDRVPYEQFA